MKTLLTTFIAFCTICSLNSCSKIGSSATNTVDSVQIIRDGGFAGGGYTFLITQQAVLRDTTNNGYSDFNVPLSPDMHSKVKSLVTEVPKAMLTNNNKPEPRGADMFEAWAIIHKGGQTYTYYYDPENSKNAIDGYFGKLIRAVDELKQ